MILSCSKFTITADILSKNLSMKKIALERGGFLFKFNKF